MSTARQVTDPYFLPTATMTPRAGHAVINRAALIPETPLAWWWGVAPGGYGAIGNTAAPDATPTPEVPATAPPSDCGGCR